MKKYRRTVSRFLILLFLFAAAAAVPASAEGTSFSYTYDFWKNSVQVPAPYTAGKPLTGDDFGQGSLNAPTDLCVAGDGDVYILDAGNNRVLVLDGQMRYKRTVVFTDAAGGALAFQEALGLFVDKAGRIFVADKTARTVFVADGDGRLIGSIDAPPADKVEEGFDYTPAKVLEDSAGILYVISANSYGGALQYDQNFQFIGFFGAQRVTPTAELMMNRFWKAILSKEQAKGLMRSVPTSVVNFDIDAENYVYTIKGGTGTGTGQVNKLNALGENILYNEEGGQAKFGDYDTWHDTLNDTDVTTSLTDITVDKDGFITVVDSTYGRIFQYDQNSNLLYAFGGEADQYGTFRSPVAVDSLGEKLLVLDKDNNNVTVFTPTPFGADVRKAILLYDDGLYAEALEPWGSVLGRDANYELANIGMGKVYEKTGDYRKAMTYYERGNDRSGYSDAFKKGRSDFIRRIFPFLLLGVVALLAAIVAATRYGERHRKSDYNLKIGKGRYPLQVMLHPFKSYYDLKVEKKGSVAVANGILLAFFLTGVLHAQLTGFPFNYNRTDHFNVFITLTMTIGLFVVWTVCNWAVSTLADGEGTFREIWIFSAYAILPYVFALILLTVLSNAFSLGESGFYSLAQAIAYIWTGVCILMAVKEVHQFSLMKTILIIAATLFGILLMLLFVSVAYSLFMQLINFIGMVYHEIRLK